MRYHCLKMCGKLWKKHAKSQATRMILEIGKLSFCRSGRLAVWFQYDHEGLAQYAGQINPAFQIIKLSAAKGGYFFDRLARNIKPAS
ncbi:hypothetical protein [Methylobacter sp.]|uniref:hypothetical protein n=1 Tax=Methylobacter sp. TaxID=2051955 RepID=UPI003DA550FD